ncbi:CPBP family intramembrane metalloprotease [Alloacidobacterium dinghuense]|uniref:CPBP family intramembrane metalloprotease n=1 Tax=Alloacidobacterium dinghuense TaxID=2763107 RepID=A0A7G8BNJ0_9BACT|nr:CPBP family intramembrane glutamic endopeptidase [Alloacidobacterium dinghuense]QNI34110.1 CPBP family intramembrane metalloprotease [Alloacidobacterium dinghuense]
MTLDPISLTPMPQETDATPSQIEAPEYFYPVETRPPVSDLPYLSHAILFFVLTIPMLFIGEALCLFLVKQSHLFGDKSYQAIFSLMASDARIAIPAQALTYLLTLLAAVAIFPVLWRRPFVQGIHWNLDVARTRFLWLFALGLGLGFGITLLGNYLPMPKDPPIMQDMMGSQLGAWMMLIFGITCAPLLEEMAFRGFLLPGFIHAFRWLIQREILSSDALSWVTIPLSVVLTTIPFALLHATQVSHAWAPLLLIGLVSVALCTIRLRLNSVAASTVVHAAYNFTLFAGLLLQTEGFRHLERLNS